MSLFLVFATACSTDDEGSSPTPTEQNGGDNENGDIDYGELKDSRDGKTYKTVEIGNQEWMAENLAYAPSSGEYWAYDEDDANIEIYGYLYDWETALKVCPSGWHLPSHAEWTQLTDYLGGLEEAGGKMKSTSGLWSSPNTDATNSSGFSGLPPGGNRAYSLVWEFNDLGHFGFWWSSTEKSPSRSWGRDLGYSYEDVGRFSTSKLSGLSCRCLKD